MIVNMYFNIIRPEKTTAALCCIALDGMMHIEYLNDDKRVGTFKMRLASSEVS